LPNEILRLLALLVLLGGNAFFVIGEYSIVTARRGALRATAEAGSAGACAALRLMDDPVEVLSTVQVGITGIGILIGTTCPTLAQPMSGRSREATAVRCVMRDGSLCTGDCGDGSGGESV